MKLTNKLIKTFLILELTFSTLFAISNNLSNPELLKHEPDKTLKDYFKFPQILINVDLNEHEQNTVEVIFKINNIGQTNFVLVKTQNIELKKEITKQFNALKLPNLKSDVVYSVMLKFKTKPE
jgi:hypothetical protein